MAAKVNLKVVNDGSEDIVRELLVDCENVFFHQTSYTKLYLVGYFKTALCFVPVWNPTKAQVFYYLLGFFHKLVYQLSLLLTGYQFQ